MQHPMKFPGYFSATAQAKDQIFRTKVGVEFGPHVDVGSGSIEYYTLAFTAHVGDTEKPYPEIAIRLRPEEALDLSDWIKEEFERVERIRKELDGGANH